MNARSRRLKKILAIFATILLALAVLLNVVSSTLVSPVFSVQTEHVIDATPEQLWTVLLDFDAYSQWNPYLIKLSGKAETGATIHYTLIDANFDAPFSGSGKMAEIEEFKRFYWTGTAGIPGVVDTRHYFVLEQESETQTRFIQYEEFRGLLAMLIPNVEEMTGNTRSAFNTMGTALQKMFSTTDQQTP